MVSVVTDKQDVIAALCRKYGVVSLYLFGLGDGTRLPPGAERCRPT